MKKKILLLMGIFSLGILNAQIGINTESPQELLHIDAKGDTNGTINTTDDIVITNEGKVGVGTITPSVTLDIIGKLDFDKAGKLNSSYVESSSTGVARWKPFKLNRVSIWTVTGTSQLFAANTEVMLSGSSTFNKNDIPNVSFSDNETVIGSITGSAITIPAGRYILYPSCDLNLREYGQFCIYEIGNPIPVISTEYSMSAIGMSFIFTISSTKKYYMTFKAINAQSLMFATPPYTTTFTAGLIIHNIP